MTDTLPDAAGLIGKTLLNKLRVVGLVGAGGMGAVYEVEHLITKHHRALKVLHAAHCENHETIQRFVREAGVAGTLHSPYVVETYDAGQLEDGAAYVLMELLRGRPLSALIEGADPPTPSRIVGIACQVLEGLAAAHAAGIVHRDIKPDNLFLVQGERGSERVKILDFGISKFTGEEDPHAPQFTLTHEGVMLGTPYYMSPEQAAGRKDIDARTDLYSLGVILYEGLAGRRPFDGQTLAALVIRIHKGEREPLAKLAPHLAPGLADVVERAMAVEREDRPSSCRELLEALLPYADSTYTTSLKTLQSSSDEGASVEAPAFVAGRSAPASIQVDVTVDRGQLTEEELATGTFDGGVDTSARTLLAPSSRALESPPAPARSAPRYAGVAIVLAIVALASVGVAYGAGLWSEDATASPVPAVATQERPPLEPVGTPPAHTQAEAPEVAVPEPETPSDPEVEPSARVGAADPEREPRAERRARPREPGTARATPDTDDPPPGGRPRLGRREIERDSPY